MTRTKTAATLLLPLLQLSVVQMQVVIPLAVLQPAVAVPVLPQLKAFEVVLPTAIADFKKLIGIVDEI